MNKNPKPHTGPRKKVLIGSAGMSKQAQDAFAKAVSEGVDAEIARLCAEDAYLPPLWFDLAHALESFAREQFGTSLNQRMLQRDRIEKIEQMCRTIGAGGTYYATAETTH